MTACPPPPCVLVEGPPWGSTASFLGGWLTAAAKAEGLWRKALQSADFAKRVFLLTVIFIPDFAAAACAFVSCLRRPLFTAFVVRLEDEDGDEFALMAAMGFFVRAGDHYRMAIPSRLTLATVKAAAIAYASTETENEEDGSFLHPEQLVVTMSFENATAGQERLQAMQEFKLFDLAPQTRKTH